MSAGLSVPSKHNSALLCCYLDTKIEVVIISALDFFKLMECLLGIIAVTVISTVTQKHN